MNLEGPTQVVVSAKFNAVGATVKIPASSKADIDKALDTLKVSKTAWVNLDIQERINILNEIMDDMQSIGDKWVKAGIEAQELQANSFGIGEKSVILAMVYRILRLLRQSLMDIQQTGQPRIPGAVSQRSNGQIVAKVFPQAWYDRLSMMGITAEIWMTPDTPINNRRPPQAAFYHGEDKEGEVVLVLGVGNVSAIVVADFMHKLFVEGKVVLLKPSPVNEYFGPLIEEGFRALIQRGFMQLVYGGPEVGAYLVQHPIIDEIHMTGSERTFDNIVFGPGEEGAKRKAAHEPKITKSITAELGNISPVIVVPGPWEDSDVKMQAAKLGSWLSVNAGYGCLTPRMIINWEEWDQRQKLNSAIGNFLSQLQTRKAYYPGATKIWEKFVAEHPEAQKFGEQPDGYLPWTLIPDVDFENREDICFTQEAFCSLFAETGLKAENVEDFIDKAVDFANENLWGTLVASIIVHPRSMKDPKIAAAVERAIEKLHYGTVVINQWGVVPYLMMITPWGSYPGQDIYDVQSGIGTVNNLLMFDHPQKAVVYCPFSQSPDPFLATSRNFPEFGRRLADFQFAPSVMTLGRLFMAVMKS